MFENLKIRNRLGKAFRIIVTTCSIAAVLGVVMLIVTMTLYKNALNNYGFSQGDIGKALVAFTDTRSATRAIVGYDDDSLISQMSDTHDERKATFEQYWEIVDEVTTTSKEQEIYDSIDAKLEDYWTTEQKAIDTGKTTDPGQSAKAQNIMIDEVAPLYDEIYSGMRDLMNTKVTEGDHLADTLSVVSLIFIIIIAVIIIVSILVSSKMGASIAKGISKPLVALENRLSTFAQGNLHDPFPEVKSNDEVASIAATSTKMAETLNAVITDVGVLMEGMANGDYTIQSEHSDKYVGDFEQLLTAMRGMRDAMVHTIQMIGEASSQVSAGSMNLAESSKHISDVAKTQANAMDQAEQGVNQISEVVQSNSASAEETSATSQELSAQATSLDELVGKFILPEDTEQ